MEIDALELMRTEPPMTKTLSSLLVALLITAPAAGAGLPLGGAAAGCGPGAAFPPALVALLAPAPRSFPAAAERLDPAQAVLRLFAERKAAERLHDEAGLPLKTDVCGEGRDRAVCLAALLKVEEAVEAEAVRDIALHHALRALFLEGDEKKLAAGARGQLHAVLAQWTSERRESIIRGRKTTGYSICIFPAKDIVDQVFIRLFTRRAVGYHHRVGSFALLNMRYGPGFAPSWNPEHPPVPVYC
jgi:hypothetical protein